MIDMVWKEFAMRKNFTTDLYNMIDVIEVSGELTITSQVYNVNTFEHFVFPLKYYFLI